MTAVPQSMTVETKITIVVLQSMVAELSEHAVRKIEIS